MSKKKFDLVIIGGGIHGAGVAQAAAARGYSVLVLEKSALAAGTSSRSSKLIHGGLRYLESAQYSLVRECLHERSLLLKLAPDLVQLKPFHIPIYPNTSRRPWLLHTGLALYGLLAGFGPGSRYSTVARRHWQTLDGLNTDGLQAVFRYHDAQTDDAALTRAVMRSAQQLGTELALPATFIQAELANNEVIIDYHHDGSDHTCHARLLVNAAGPWANDILSRITPTPSSMAMELVQGSHIIVDQQVGAGMYYVEAPSDKRAVFVMPWKNKMLIGTTETPYSGSADAVTPTQAEIDYLWHTLAHYFPQFRQQGPECIESAFAGLRVLPCAPGASFSRPRDTYIHPDRQQKPRLLTLYGGKLTAYRSEAEKLIKRIESIMPKRKPVGTTRRLALSAD